jgi:hypothetical protein
LKTIGNERFNEESLRTNTYRYIEAHIGTTINEMVRNGFPLVETRHCVKALCAEGKIMIRGWEREGPRLYRFNKVNNDAAFAMTHLNKVLLKEVGISQYKDGVRINKEFHDVFNPPDDPSYCARGAARPITVKFNKKIFVANYRYEGTKAVPIELQRIGFSKELANEFKEVFPNPNGFFRIMLDGDINHFEFLYDNIDANELNAKLEEGIEKARAGSRKERLKRLSQAQAKPNTTQVTSIAFIRNPDVIAEVLERAKGICEHCSCNAPFTRRRDNTPYLEVHHRIQLSEGGSDTVENAIAVCPNCHRELHYG